MSFKATCRLTGSIWLGGLAAFLIFFPNLLWNIHYHWPFLELMHNIRAEGRDVVLSFPQYFFQQTVLVDPITAPIWLAGLCLPQDRREVGSRQAVLGLRDDLQSVLGSIRPRACDRVPG